MREIGLEGRGELTQESVWRDFLVAVQHKAFELLQHNEGIYMSIVRVFISCKERVHNRGVAPNTFLNEFVD